MKINDSSFRVVFSPESTTSTAIATEIYVKYLQSMEISKDELETYMDSISRSFQVIIGDYQSKFILDVSVDWYLWYLDNERLFRVFRSSYYANDTTFIYNTNQINQM